MIIIGIMKMAVPASIRFQEEAAAPEDFSRMIPTTKGMRLGSVMVNTMGSM